MLVSTCDHHMDCVVVYAALRCPVCKELKENADAERKAVEEEMTAEYEAELSQLEDDLSEAREDAETYSTQLIAAETRVIQLEEDLRLADALIVELRNQLDAREAER